MRGVPNNFATGSNNSAIYPLIFLCIDFPVDFRPPALAAIKGGAGGVETPDCEGLAELPTRLLLKDLPQLLALLETSLLEPSPHDLGRLNRPGGDVRSDHRDALIGERAGRHSARGELDAGHGPELGRDGLAHAGARENARGRDPPIGAEA